MLIDLRKKHWQYTVLFMLGLTWGSSFILMKQGLKSYTPIEVACMRLFFSFLFLFPIVFWQFKHVPRAKFKYLFLAGILGNGIPAFMFATAQTRIESALSGILNATTPIFTLIVGAVLFGLHFKKNALGGIVIGLIGTIYLLAFNIDFSENSNQYLFAALPLVGSICYGFSTNIIKKHLKELSPILVTGGAILFVGPPCLAWLLWDGVFTKAMSSPEHLVNAGFLMILGVVGTALAVLIFNFLIKHTTVLFAASVTYLIPMFSIIWGLIFGEAVTIHYFLGIAIILTGIYLVNK